MAILYVGIDIAKNVFAVHGVDETSKPALVRPAVPRAKLHELIATIVCPLALNGLGSHGNVPVEPPKGAQRPGGRL